MKRTQKKSTIESTQRENATSVYEGLVLGKSVVLVRNRSAGVHCGTLLQISGTVVELANATRIWRWRGANTLSELSQRGCSNVYSRISEAVPHILLTEAIEVIMCSEVAARSLLASGWAA